MYKQYDVYDSMYILYLSLFINLLFKVADERTSLSHSRTAYRVHHNIIYSYRYDTLSLFLPNDYHFPASVEVLAVCVFQSIELSYRVRAFSSNPKVMINNTCLKD